MNIVCIWCGQEFERPNRKGRPPSYCSASHRQQAHHARRRGAAVSDVADVVGRVAGISGAEGFRALHDALQSAAEASEFAVTKASGPISAAFAAASSKIDMSMMATNLMRNIDWASIVPKLNLPEIPPIRFPELPKFEFPDFTTGVDWSAMGPKAIDWAARIPSVDWSAYTTALTSQLDGAWRSLTIDPAWFKYSEQLTSMFNGSLFATDWATRWVDEASVDGPVESTDDTSRDGRMMQVAMIVALVLMLASARDPLAAGAISVAEATGEALRMLGEAPTAEPRFNGFLVAYGMFEFISKLYSALARRLSEDRRRADP